MDIEYDQVDRDQRRQVIIVFLAILFVFLLAVGIYVGFRINQHSRQIRQQATQQDTQARNAMRTFSDRLTAYYAKHQQYPSIQQLSEQGISPDRNYTYVSTARDGDNCDGVSKQCTRIVTTTQLHADKSYVVVLENNKAQAY